MAYHLTDEPFAGSAAPIAMVAALRDTSPTQKRKRVTCYRCQKIGHMASECMAPRPVTQEADASAAVAVSNPPNEPGFAWSLNVTDGTTLDAVASILILVLHNIFAHVLIGSNHSQPKLVELLVLEIPQLISKDVEQSDFLMVPN